ncbi:MAG: serine/threonine protein kinase, partial [Salinibacterium sp.]|nr:serine/threonine protein kinase [Salinibacterium sp.]
MRCPACRRAFSCQDGDDWTSLDCPGCGQGIRLTEELAPPSDGDGTIRIAHFELEARVGQGGFGTVWRARDGRLDRIVAVKIPRRGRLMGEAEIEGFLHEARVAAQLRHPGIVTVHEIGREHGTVYIVSDFIDGQSLSRDGIDHELSVEEVAATLATVCRALHEAHELGVTHRDLKPQNI